VHQPLADTDEFTREMDGKVRLGSKMVCPLMAGDECLVYPVRPVPCRTYPSLDALNCESFLVNGQQGLRIRPDILVTGMGLMPGLTRGLRKAGLQTPLLELTAGARLALDKPELTGRWLAGTPVFSEAQIERSKWKGIGDEQ